MKEERQAFAREEPVETVDERLLKLRQAVDAIIQNTDFPDLSSLGAPPFTIDRYVRLRRLRESLFPKDMFHDPAWDILLELHIEDAKGKGISVTAACTCAPVPATTALRYVHRLVKAGLVIRTAHPTDRRRIELSLSPMAREALARWEKAALSFERVPNMKE